MRFVEARTATVIATSAIESSDAPAPCPADDAPGIHRISGGRVQPSDIARSLASIASSGRGPSR
jgi:hypothetical protein